MRKNNDTQHISDLLSKSTFADTKGDKIANVMKHSTIFSFWNDIVGQKFAKFTKPISIKGSKIYVSAKSPVIVQELTLYKAKILKTINSYSLPLGIEIKDLVLNYKNFSATTPQELNNEIEDKPVEIKKSDLNSINIDKNLENQIKKNINKLKFLNNEQKENFSNKIMMTYKAKSLQEKK